MMCGFKKTLAALLLFCYSDVMGAEAKFVSYDSNSFEDCLSLLRDYSEHIVPSDVGVVLKSVHIRRLDEAVKSLTNVLSLAGISVPEILPDTAEIGSFSLSDSIVKELPEGSARQKAFDAVVEKYQDSLSKFRALIRLIGENKEEIKLCFEQNGKRKLILNGMNEAVKEARDAANAVTVWNGVIKESVDMINSFKSRLLGKKKAVINVEPEPAPEPAPEPDKPAPEPGNNGGNDDVWL